MFPSSRTTGLGLTALVASALMSSPNSTFASEPCREAPGTPDNVILGCAPDYSGYYAPYAILSAISFVPLEKLENEKRVLLQKGGIGLDVYSELAKYAVKEAFTKDSLNASDEEIIKEFGATRKQIHQDAVDRLGPGWRYEFGNEAGLDCFDSADEGCKRGHPTGPSGQNQTEESAASATNSTASAQPPGSKRLILSTSGSNQTLRYHGILELAEIPSGPPDSNV